MSHILKEYAKNLDVSPSSLFVNKHYYPIITDDYIVVYNEQSIDSKRYNYYSLVVDLMRERLNELGIKVVVVGSDKEVSDRYDFKHTNLSFRENAYIISKAKLLISVDNAMTQYASDQNVPIVTLYGNVYPSITTPYWSNKNKKIDLEPKWDKRPSLALSDSKDPINKIPAEDVAEACLKLLKVQNAKVNFRTKKINKNKSVMIDVIPSDYVNMRIFENQLLNLRLDKGVGNELAVFQYCSNHKCNITVKDALINPDSFTKIAQNIEAINLIITTETVEIPKEYFKAFKKLNITVNILVTDEEILDKIRFKFFEQNVMHHNPPKEKPKDLPSGCKFLSFKMVVDKGSIYKSTYHWKNNIDNSDNVVDNPLYWEELDYFYIYEQS